MWTDCITSISHVLKLNGYGGPQAKANEKRLRFKGWETLVIQPNVIGGSEDGKPALRYHCKDTTLFVTTKLLVVVCLKTRTFAVS